MVDVSDQDEGTKLKESQYGNASLKWMQSNAWCYRWNKNQQTCGFHCTRCQLVPVGVQLCWFTCGVLLFQHWAVPNLKSKQPHFRSRNQAALLILLGEFRSGCSGKWDERKLQNQPSAVFRDNLFSFRTACLCKAAVPRPSSGQFDSGSSETEKGLTSRPKETAGLKSATRLYCIVVALCCLFLYVYSSIWFVSSL